MRADFVKETTTTTGLGAYDLDGAAVGFQSFATAGLDAETVVYAVTDGVDFEVSTGVFSSGAPDSLSRVSVLASSDSNVPINWGAGTKTIKQVVSASEYGDFLTSALPTDYLTFNTTAAHDVGVGEIAWNEKDGTLDIGLLNGTVVLQVGQEIILRVRADAAIADGKVVYATGSLGASGIITADLFIADGSIDEVYTLGIATESITLNGSGYITTQGKIRGISTNGSEVSETWVDGDILYPSPTTAGELTKVKPEAPNLAIAIAIVVVAHPTNGTIYVNPRIGEHLGELHDVYAPTPSNGHVLTWVAANNRYEVIAVTIAEDLDISGDTTIGDSAADALTVNATVTSDLIFTDNLYDIGKDTATRPRHVYIAQNLVTGGTATFSGNVGIGTSSTSYKAEIDSGSLGTSLNDRLDTLRLTTETSNVDTLNFSKIRTSAGTDWTTAGWRLQQRVDATNMGYIQLNGDSNSQGISFGVGDGTEHMRITDTGNVGIGKSPGTKLDVNGTVTATGGNSTDWNTAYGWGDHASAGYLVTDTTGNKAVNGNPYLTQDTLTDGATITWTTTNGTEAFVTLGGNRTLVLDAVPPAGTWLTLLTRQDGTGSRTLAYSATYFAFGAAGTPVLSTAANAYDILSFRSNGTRAEFVGIAQGFTT